MPNWWIVIYKDSGEAYSIGDSVADPLPQEFVAVPLSGADADALMMGRAAWDAASRSIIRS